MHLRKSKTDPTLHWPQSKAQIGNEYTKSLGILVRCWCEKYPEALGYSLWTTGAYRNADVTACIDTWGKKNPYWTDWYKQQSLRVHSILGGKIISLVMLMELFKAIIYWSSLGSFILWDSSAGTLSPFPGSSLLAIDMPDSWHRHRWMKHLSLHSYC